MKIICVMQAGPKVKAACLISALLAGGCSLAPGGSRIEGAATTIVATGISDRQRFNDKKAETLLILPCDISLGAYLRIQNTVQQEALLMLCSGKLQNESTPLPTSSPNMR